MDPSVARREGEARQAAERLAAKDGARVHVAAALSVRDLPLTPQWERCAGILDYGAYLELLNGSREQLRWI